VAYDPRLADCIYLVTLRGEDLDAPYLCKLSMKLRNQVAYVGKCFAEIRELQEQDARNAATYAHAEHEANLQAHRDHKELVANAKERTQNEAVAGVSPTAQIQAIAQNRKAERFDHSPGQALTPRLAVSEPVQGATVQAVPEQPVDHGQVDAPLDASQEKRTTASSSPAPQSQYRDRLRSLTQRNQRTES